MAGDDVLLGGSGNDQFWPGKGDDRIDGGPGPDAVSYGFAHAPIVVRLYDHSAKGQGGDSIYRVASVSGGPRDDCLIGNNGPNLLFGEAGNDAIFGLDGHDRLAAGREGGAIVGGGGPDWIQGSHASDSEEAGEPPCFLDPDQPVRSGLYGSNGNDRITGGDGRDVVDGGPGADRLFGGDGADSIDGRRGFDRASGGQGSDECLHVEVRRSC
jgi:Ca2+-binding RTX toxin-like protein